MWFCKRKLLHSVSTNVMMHDVEARRNVCLFSSYVDGVWIFISSSDSFAWVFLPFKSQTAFEVVCVQRDTNVNSWWRSLSWGVLCCISNCCHCSSQATDKSLLGVADGFFNWNVYFFMLNSICTPPFKTPIKLIESNLLEPKTNLTKLTSAPNPVHTIYCEVWSSLNNELSATRTAVRRIGTFQKHWGPGQTEIDHLRTYQSQLYHIWIIKWPEAVKSLHCLVFSRCF